MKKLLIFYPQLDHPQTGGQVIDFEFIHQIQKSGLFELSYFLDSDIKSISNAYYNWYLVTHVWRFMKYDVIFMNSRTYPRMLFFVLLLRIFLFKGKLITYHHHYNFETSNGWVKYIHRFAELTFLKCMSEILIPSPFVLDLTKKYLPISKTVFIPIGFNKRIVEYSDEKEGSRIICVGSIDRRKRTHQVVEIAHVLNKQFPELRFDIVGGVLEPDYEQEIRNLIKRYQLDNVVVLHGRVDDETLTSLYQKALLFVFPSSYEGYGMVLVEAMSHGLPVVAYDNSAMPYTVKDGYNGFLATDGDYRYMAELIQNFLENRRIEDFRQNAISYIMELPSINDMKIQMSQYIHTIAPNA